MNIYLAASSEHALKVRDYCAENDFETYKLESFFYLHKSKWLYDRVIDIHTKYKGFMLDSGAFTFIMKQDDLGMDIDYFTDAYIDFINITGIELFYEMDIDNVIGYEGVKRLRDRIESKTGKQSIPVFHMDRGLDDYIAMCKDYPYVALGVFGKDFTYTDWRSAKVLVDTAHEYGAKVHGLGVTGRKVLSKVDFDSVDSSSWLHEAILGIICYFTGTKMVKRRYENRRIKDRIKLTCHNYAEWVKLGAYLENRKLWI